MLYLNEDAVSFHKNMNPKSLENLKKTTAPDAPGLGKSNSKVVPVRLSTETIEAIAKLGGDRSYHLRVAITRYLDAQDD